MTDRPTCSIDGCDRDVRCRTMCYPHYLRWRRGVDLTKPLATRDRPVRRCELDNCDEEHYALGLCRWHYKTEWSGRDPHSLKRNPNMARYRGAPPPPPPAA